MSSELFYFKGMMLLNKTFNDLDRARLDAIFEEYRKVNMGIDERVRMVRLIIYHY